MHRNLYRDQPFLRRSRPKPNNAPPTKLKVAGSGIALELMFPCTVVLPICAPDEGFTILVCATVWKNVEPKFPEIALLVPGPSCSGCQLRVMVLASKYTDPAAAVPTKTPLASSVTSVMTTSNVKAEKKDPMPPAC